MTVYLMGDLARVVFTKADCTALNVPHGTQRHACDGWAELVRESGVLMELRATCVFDGAERDALLAACRAALASTKAPPARPRVDTFDQPIRKRARA